MCVCMVATACGGSNSSTNGGDSSNGDDASAVKDNLVIAVQTDMADKDPINGSTTNDTIKIKAQVYETLIERTVPDQEYKPLLAEKWEFNDDGTELTITLRTACSPCSACGRAPTSPLPTTWIWTRAMWWMTRPS